MTVHKVGNETMNGIKTFPAFPPVIHSSFTCISTDEIFIQLVQILEWLEKRPVSPLYSHLKCPPL